jgi:hypothetical protein
MAAGDTVALGQLPGPLSASTTPLTPPPAETTTAPTITTIPDVEPVETPIGDVVDGNRMLLIGDTAMATITPRQEGIGCDVLSGLGWEVEIEAEPGRFLPFADEVIDEVVVDAGEDWDAVGLMFGHFIDTPVEEFASELDRILQRLGDVPILLYTVAENDDPTAIAVNEVIRERDDRPNVVVVDWGAAVAFEEVADLVEDDRTPTVDGMNRLVLLTASALGEPPGSGGGACLDAVFTDDSAIVLEG